MGPAGGAGEGGGGASRRRRRRTRPGRTLLGFLVFYTVAFGALALAGYDDALPALRLVVGTMAGYGVGHLASQSPGRAGEIVATILFFAALGAMTIISAVVVASRTAEASDPWWLASLGFASGVFAAAYVRLKYFVER
jgi:hypothetical protein